MRLGLFLVYFLDACTVLSLFAAVHIVYSYRLIYGDRPVFETKVGR